MGLEDVEWVGGLWRVVGMDSEPEEEKRSSFLLLLI
jgi:hypothetical protein